MRLGILGGAFNPPHLGHLILAQEAHSQLGLDTVVFVPFSEPTHRVLEDDPGAEARFTMCEYAVGADARLGVSRIEIERGGPSFTVDTLRELASRSGGSDELFLLLGGDQAAALPRWRDPVEVLSLAVVAVAEREGFGRDEVLAGLSALAGEVDLDERVRFFSMPRVDVSSSLVRARARDRQPIRYLVPDKVANYVGAQSLYGASAEAGGRASGDPATAFPARTEAPA